MPNRAFYYQHGDNRVYPERILYLNVRPHAGSTMNAVLFVVDRETLQALNDREWIYRLEPVNECLRGVRVTGGNVFLYVAREEFLTDLESDPSRTAVLSSYLSILNPVIDALPEEEQQRYRDTTDPVPQHLVIEDVLDPKRPNPWENAGYQYQP